MKKLAFTFIMVLALHTAPLASAQTTEDIQRVALLQQINLLLEQIKELQLQVTDREQSSVQSSILSPSAIIKTRYRVYNTNDFSWVKASADAALMERFVELSPSLFDARITEVVIFDDPESNLDAFVETLGSPSYWRVGFSSEIKRFPIDQTQTTELFIHEIGHLVSLEEVRGQKLLDQFEKEFWADNKSQYSFVSEYAKQSVAEDFAESFLQYVINDGMYRGVAAEKVTFFSRYASTQNFRNEIRSKI